MKVLISPISLAEAQVVIEAGCDILDVKNVKEGSLGAQPPWVLKDIVGQLGGRGVLLSATLGDLPYKPGTCGLAAFGCAQTGVDYVKAGLMGARNRAEAAEMMDSVVRSVRMVSERAITVASGYADHRRFGGASHLDVAWAARDAGADVAMLDTYIKDGKNLFDAMTEAELAEFIRVAHEGGLLVALAGSVQKAHIETLHRLGTDIVGVRGAVCEGGDRTTGITREGCLAFMSFARSIAPKGKGRELRRAAARTIETGAV